MAGTKEGGKKAYLANIKKDPDFYKKIGQKGGSSEYEGKKGFAALPKKELSKIAKLGGSTKRKTK